MGLGRLLLAVNTFAILVALCANVGERRPAPRHAAHDFRSGARDGGLVADFWTADVFALYGMLPVAADGPCSCDRRR